ncbi:MAG: hypothetical protein ACRDY1_11075 [Acidimicrobiales bacterium]
MKRNVKAHHRARVGTRSVFIRWTGVLVLMLIATYGVGSLGPPAAASVRGAATQGGKRAGTALGLPSYSGSTWTKAELAFNDRFRNLKNWNYGLTDTDFSGTSGSYVAEGQTGTYPDVGSDEEPQWVADYDVPGNVSQTSTGANPALFSGYKPQVFKKKGSGVTFTAHYTGPVTYDTTNEGNLTFDWTSGCLNTFNKFSFPDQAKGDTEAYVQMRIMQMGYNGTDNGAYNAWWFLGQDNSDSVREIDLQETGKESSAANLMNAHIQSPLQQVTAYDTGDNLSTTYHVYAMDLNYKTNTLNMYFDNQLVGTISNADFGGPYYMILVGALSSGDQFPAPTNDGDMQMRVSQVQVYER